MTSDDRFDDFLDALARSTPRERDRPVPPEILRAFAAQAAADHPPAAPPVPHRPRFGFLAKTTVCALIVSGSAAGVAAAADVLPQPAQSVAHAIFGPLGVPAPQHSTSSPHQGHPSRPTPSPSPVTSKPSPAAPSSAAPTASPGKTHTPTRAHGTPKPHLTSTKDVGNAQHGNPSHAPKSGSHDARSGGV